MAVVTHKGRVTEGIVREAKEAEATEYERQLSDKELVGLAVHIRDRTAALLAQGVPLPMQEIENHHLIGLLECFVGPEDSLRVREWHLTWLDGMLDKAEAAIRAQMISRLDGLPTDDLPGFP